MLAIRPKAICALGSTAAKALLGTKDGVTRLRGNWQKWRDIPVMVTYHPSYLLRPYNQNAKREAWEDLKKVLHYVYDDLKRRLATLIRGRRPLHHLRRDPMAAANPTQADTLRLVRKTPARQGITHVLETAEPGGTPIGLQIRRILLDAKNQELCPTAELLLMFAARAQNVDQWILPALVPRQIVLCDRFTDSSLVYQGAGRGLGAEVVYEVDRVACRGLIPDLTLVIDIDVDAGLTRARRRNERPKMRVADR